MSKVNASKSILEWAISRSGKSSTDLRKKFSKLDNWLSGIDQPTFKQLEDFARATSTPFGYFFLAAPPKIELPIPHYRTLDDDISLEPSPDLLETLLHMQQRQSWIREYFIENAQEPLKFVASKTIKDSASSIAQQMRRELGISSGWAAKHLTWSDALRDLQEAMEAAGLLVVVNGIVGNNTSRKLSVEEFRGFVLVDEYVPLVFVNGSDGKAAQMFTLAHELAHVFLGKSAAFDLKEMQAANNPIEQLCDKAAAEFLVPEIELNRIWPEVKKRPKPFDVVARHFKVSFLVAARRGLDLGLISRKEFFSVYDQYLATEKRNKSKMKSGGDFYATQALRVGRRFGETLVRAVKEGRILYNDAYRLTGLHGKSFERFAKDRGFGGNSGE